MVLKKRRYLITHMHLYINNNTNNNTTNNPKKFHLLSSNGTLRP